MTRQLYECKIELFYYAWAENESEARSYASEAVSDCLSSSDIKVAHIEHPPAKLKGVWDHNCLTYTAKDVGDIMLWEIFEQMSEEAP